MNPRRDVDLHIEVGKVPQDWYARDAFSTTFLTALSLLFPEGERFFIDSVRQFRGEILDHELGERVRGFIGQESIHGREHRAFNAMIAPPCAAAAVEARLRRLLGFARRILSPRSQLAVTCALEHFTAILAEQLLTVRRLREDLDPSVRVLWIWHALEESEHKAVAFDVYRATRGGYARRIVMMILTSFVFFCVQSVAHAQVMSARGILVRPWRWASGIVRMWIWPGYCLRLAPAYLAYFRPRFHPRDHDNRALLATWRDALFGDSGELRDQSR